MRLLIVDGNLLTWVARRLVPGGVEVETATAVEQAREILRDDPPDAVLLNVKQATGPWREIARACRCRRPPIPTLFHGGVCLDPAEAGIEVDDHSFFTESLCARDLDRLIHAAENVAAST